VSFFIAATQERNEGTQFPGRQMTAGDAEKSQLCHIIGGGTGGGGAWA